MRALSFKRHRFLADVVVSFETIRCWTIKFSPHVARNLKRKRPALLPQWHRDEVACNNGGERMYLWRAVDDEGEVLDVVVQKRRDHDATLTLLKRLRRNQPVELEAIVTDRLASYGSALRELDLETLHRPGGLRENNRAENSHPAGPKAGAEDAALQQPGISPAFLTIHATIYNTFYIQRNLISRPTLRRFRAEADDAWMEVVARRSEGRASRLARRLI